MRDLRTVKKIFVILFLVTIALSAVTFWATFQLSQSQARSFNSAEARYSSYQLADELRQSSDDLTRLARTYVVTGDPKYEQQYWHVLDIRNGKKPRPQHYERIYWDLVDAGVEKPSPDGETIALVELMKRAGFTEQEFGKLKEAQANSDGLVNTEVIAMNAVKGLFDDGTGKFVRKGPPDLEMARRLMHDEKYHQYKGRIMKPVSEFFELLDTRTGNEVAQSNELVHQKLLLAVASIASIVIGLMVASIMCVWLIGTIRRQLKETLNLAKALTEGTAKKLDVVKAISDGNLEQEITVTSLPKIDLKTISTDEVGALIKTVVDMSDVQASLDGAFMKMSTSLRSSRETEDARDWLKSGQNDLSALMRGEHETSEMGGKVLGYLAERMGAGVGALYLYDEREEALRLVATYALTRRKSLGDRFGLGEGLIGQAAREKKTICLANIPPDYLSISSALGEAVPRNVTAVPLLHGDTLVGALELGSFKRFSDTELEFLERAREGLAIGFGVNQSRHRTQQLLEQTQQQAEELRVQQEELQQSNEELEERAEMLERQREQLRTKSQEVEAASREIQRKATELERANTYKSEFLANMSHELRTPLNSMLILSGLLKQNKDQNLTDKQVEYATTINGAGKDLLNLINDILDLSKVEAGKIELHYEEVSAQAICEQMETLFHPIAEQRGLAFRVEKQPEVPSLLHLDPARTQQVLKNLLSNALKFTQEGEASLRIHLPAGADNPLAVPSVAFSVADTGIGIPKGKQSLVFDAFKQADSGVSRKYGGTGLGLSISRQLAGKMGGELKMTSSEGKGSVFTLYLPLAGLPVEVPMSGRRDLPQQRDSTPAAVPPSAAGTVGIAGESDEDTLPSAPIPDDREHLQPGDKSILIVEDDLKFAQILMDFVRQDNFKAIVAGDGESSITLANHYLPNAIVLDVLLPHIDGWGVMRSLKDNPRTRHIPVHFITGEEDRKKAMDMGAIGFVTKPVSAEQLSEVFHTIESSVDKSVKKLLIVEDNQVEANSMFALLSERDVVIKMATNGAQAIEMLTAEQFDCMVLDLGLSDMSGFDLLKHVQGMDEARRIPVIIHSGRDLTRDEERELRRYAESIIVKGAKSPERLLNEVTLFLHLVESNLHPSKQRMIRAALDKEAMLEEKKVLLVDDDMRNIFSLTSLLAEKNMIVVEAENGKDALLRLDENPDVNLVLLDIMMPEMDGYATMREIRQDPRFRKLPIIAMTAKAMKGDQQKCLDAGASDYIAKPIDIDKLMSLLRVWMFRQG